METMIWTALAYTLMTSDDHKQIMIRAPFATVTVPTPAGFPNKFCTRIANGNYDAVIFVAGLGEKPLKLYPLTAVPLSIKDGQWDVKEKCE